LTIGPCRGKSSRSWPREEWQSGSAVSRLVAEKAERLRTVRAYRRLLDLLVDQRRSLDGIYRIGKKLRCDDRLHPEPRRPNADLGLHGDGFAARDRRPGRPQ